MCETDFMLLGGGGGRGGGCAGRVPSISEQESQKFPSWITYKHISKSYLEPSLNNMYTIDTIWKSIFEQIWKKTSIFYAFFTPLLLQIRPKRLEFFREVRSHKYLQYIKQSEPIYIFWGHSSNGKFFLKLFSIFMLNLHLKTTSE